MELEEAEMLKGKRKQRAYMEIVKIQDIVRRAFAQSIPQIGGDKRLVNLSETAGLSANSTSSPS